MKERIQSVDILRGITIAAMILVNTPGDWNHVYKPLLHAPWHGLTPTDLIFPFFIFIVGISIAYAYKNAHPEKSTYKKIALRSVKLIALGLFLNLFTPFFPFISDLQTVRIPGVLQRIGIVFFISAVIFLNFNWKQIIGISAGMLLAYWLFMGWTPLPDGSIPIYERAANNWANYIDLAVLKKHLWQSDYDPEGILSTIPAIVTCLIGILVAKILQLKTTNKTFILASIALILWVSGRLWGHWFPINKALWTSSFVLITAGWATSLLTGIHYIADVKKIKFGNIFIYAGTNAISIYFLSSFISKCFYLIKVTDTDTIHSFIFTNYFATPIRDLKLASLLYALSVTLFYLAVAYIMFRKKWIVKV